VNDQIIIENNEILIKSNRKEIKSKWGMILFLEAFLICTIACIIYGFLENNPAYITIGIVFLIGLNIGFFYSVRSIGRLKCEINYFKNQIKEIELKNSHPNMIRIK